MDDMESSHDELRRSKRQRKEFSFGDNLYTYLIENEPSSFFEAISSPTHCFRNKQLKLSLTLF